jgi:hypothetical protein
MKTIHCEHGRKAYLMKKSDFEKKLYEKFPFMNKKKIEDIIFATKCARIVFKEKKVEQPKNNLLILKEETEKNNIRTELLIEKEEFKKIMGFKKWPDLYNECYIENKKIITAYQNDEMINPNIYSKFYLDQPTQTKIKTQTPEGPLK